MLHRNQIGRVVLQNNNSYFILKIVVTRQKKLLRFLYTTLL